MKCWYSITEKERCPEEAQYGNLNICKAAWCSKHMHVGDYKLAEFELQKVRKYEEIFIANLFCDDFYH